MNYNPFEHISFKSVFDPKIMDFESVALAKVVHIYVCDKRHECIIYII
jgi:hypothetical protein